MTFFYLTLALLFILAIINYFGLPEGHLPAPPIASRERIIKNAGPYRFEGDSGIAFIISHGYGGSAFNTRPLGKFIHSLGHSAIGLLMPGHGTEIEDLQKTRFYHWEEYLEQRYLEERSRYRKIFLVGFSMGGTISLKVAAKNADSFRPAGLITISTPVFFNGFYNGKMIIHNISIIFTGILKIVQPIMKFNKTRPQSTERMNPWIGYRYVHALPALHHFKRSMASVRHGLPRITVPYCSIMAANDRTVSAENQTYIFNRVHSRDKRALMFILPPDLTSMHSLLTHKRVNHRVFRFIESFIRETLEDINERNRKSTPAGFWDRFKQRFNRRDLSHRRSNLIHPRKDRSKSHTPAR